MNTNWECLHHRAVIDTDNTMSLLTSVLKEIQWLLIT